MRKRKRDWPITVYKFWARPLELPQSVWDTAQAMATLWNALVRLYDDAQFASETLPEADIKDIRKNTEAAAFALVAKSGLNWECGPEVLDRFRASRTRAIRALRLGQTAQKAGFPRFHRLLDSVANHLGIVLSDVNGLLEIEAGYTRQLRLVTAVAGIQTQEDQNLLLASGGKLSLF